MYIFNFEGNNWLESKVIVPIDSSVSSNFDGSVALGGGVHYGVGAAKTTINLISPSVVHFYEGTGDSWLETRRIVNPNLSILLNPT